MRIGNTRRICTVEPLETPVEVARRHLRIACDGNDISTSSVSDPRPAFGPTPPPMPTRSTLAV